MGVVNLNGTTLGDIAYRVANYSDKRGVADGEIREGPPIEVTVLDANPDMLEEGAKKINNNKSIIMHTLAGQ